MTHDLREPRSRNGEKIVAAVPFGKDSHFRGLAISCQFGCRKNARGADFRRRTKYGEPRRRESHRQELLADALRARRLPEYEERNVRAKLERHLHQRTARQAEPP